MKAVILSGGMGKRLRPLTDYLPKPLVPVCNVPIIEWQIRYFKKFKIDEIIICAGYRAEQIVSFLDSRSLNVKTSFSIEKSPLGTGGAIYNARKYIGDEAFFVINGDVITNLDLNKLKEHPNSIAVIQLKTNFGIVHLNENRVEKFEEKPELSNYWMNAGVYYLENNTIKLLPKTGNIENTTFPALSKMNRLHAIRYNKVFWHSIDSHKDMNECTDQMRAVKYEKFLSVK
ncbi:MAG: nucleotidyltransferase family protein [Thaumarchaeota archaeon]|nr:nucleotidyltransferase family protein [Nitrososphaerota archaeon]